MRVGAAHRSAFLAAAAETPAGPPLPERPVRSRSTGTPAFCRGGEKAVEPLGRDRGAENLVVVAAGHEPVEQRGLGRRAPPAPAARAGSCRRRRPRRRRSPASSWRDRRRARRTRPWRPRMVAQERRRERDARLRVEVAVGEEFPVLVGQRRSPMTGTEEPRMARPERRIADGAGDAERLAGLSRRACAPCRPAGTSPMAVTRNGQRPRSAPVSPPRSGQPKSRRGRAEALREGREPVLASSPSGRASVSRKPTRRRRPWRRDRRRSRRAPSGRWSRPDRRERNARPPRGRRP